MPETITPNPRQYDSPITAPLTAGQLAAWQAAAEHDYAQHCSLQRLISNGSGTHYAGPARLIITPQQPIATQTRVALVTVTDSTGQQIGATLPIEISRHGWSDQTAYETAEHHLKQHAEHYANAAQGPASFPLTVTLHDRSGPVTLFQIEPDSSGSATLTDHLEGLSRCERCCAIHDTDDGSIVDTTNNGTRNGWSTELWCPECVQDHATACDHCGTVTDTNDTTEDGNGRVVCSHCADSHYFRCDDCEELHHNDAHNTVDGYDSVCDHCIEAGSGYRYHYHHDDGTWRTDPPDDDDDDTDDSHQSPPTMLRYGYHTDANDTLRHDIPNTGHTYGAELEYKGSPTDWQQVADACHRRAILTNDSTVSGELVSIAASAGTIRRWLANTAAALHGTRNDTETGLHIHIDRRALTPWQWYTLSHYAATHASTLEAIAGRSANRWQNIKELPAPSWPTFAKRWATRAWPNRYAGFNLSKGPTVEIRICRASKTPARALARFAMVQRLVALGRLAPSQRPQTAGELRGWLAQDRNIREVTGWQVGSFNYREAMMKEQAQGDQQPDKPSAESIQQARLTLSRLEAERTLAETLRWNARTRYVHATEAQGPQYGRDAQAVWLHRCRDCERIANAIGTARNELTELETLASLT